MPAPERTRWTRADVEKLIAENPLQTPRYELVDGELLVTPSPSYLHQRVVAEFFRVLDPYVRRQRLGRVYFSPSDTELEPETYVQPDLYVVSREEDRRLLTENRVRHAILAVEVLSPGSARGDRGRKRRLYQRTVPEYWIGDPDARIVERWRAGDERPEILAETLTWQPAGSTAALAVDLVALFAEVYGEREGEGEGE